MCASPTAFPAGRPRRAGRYGAAYTRYEWREFGKGILACAISAALILVAVAIIDDPKRTAALTAWLSRLAFVLMIWALFPIGYTLWPRKPPNT
jgi:hypothetical protein